MFHFQELDVYKCAVAFLPKAYRIASLGDGENGQSAPASCVVDQSELRRVRVAEQSAAHAYVYAYAHDQAFGRLRLNTLCMRRSLKIASG